ncbi:MAG: o-succinylbenzoate synthase, partial [Actinomycetota bacterium]
ELEPVSIDAVELRRIALPLVAPFRTSFGTETARDILLVRVVADGVEGWGECVAGNEPLYSSEYVEGAQQVIEHHLLPRLGRRDVHTEHVQDRLMAVKDHRMAKAALEAAVLDAQLRQAGVSMARYLGATRTSVPSGVSVGIAESIDALVTTVGRYLDDGYVRIKLKIEPGWDLEPVRAIRAAYGNAVPLQVDANAAYTRADGPLLAQLDQFDLLFIEQPLPEDDVTGHALIARQVATPVCLDESIVSTAAAEDAIERGACSIINIKAGRVGGYLEAVRIHDLCRSQRIPVWCGGMLETGIGRAMNLALAALPNFSITWDVSASERFWQRDIVTAPVRLENGQVRVPDGPGSGVEVDRDFLEAVTTSVRTLA